MSNLIQIFENNYILPIIIIIPLISILLLLFVHENNKEFIHKITLYTTLIIFLLSIFLWIQYDKLIIGFQFINKLGTIPYLNINIYIGLDSISLFFLLLSTFLIPFCILLSRNTIKYHIKEYMICFLILEWLLILTFSILDLLLFYIFFEAILMPMMLIIGIWGSRERKINAAYQFFIYTLFGSVFFLLAILNIYYETGTTDISILLTLDFNFEHQLILWLAFFASFAIKIPMIPVHTWLPEAHVEAPTSGSVILAGVLLKLGGYGFLRFSIPMFTEASLYYKPFIFLLSIIAIIYISLITLRQIDLKKIIAYSSIAHMAYVTLGLLSLNLIAIEGSILLMLSHGLISSSLFICIGIIYDRHKTRIIKYYTGLIQVMPLFIIIFFIFTLANLSFPTTFGFIGEFLVLIGLFQTNKIIALLSSIGMILGAAYSIWLWNRIACGNLKIYFINNYIDLNYREIIIFIPLIFLTFYFGIYPEIIIDTLHITIKNLY